MTQAEKTRVVCLRIRRPAMALHTPWRGWTDWSSGTTIISNSHSSSNSNGDQGGSRGQQAIIICYHPLINNRGVEGERRAQAGREEQKTHNHASSPDTPWALAGRQELCTKNPTHSTLHLLHRIALVRVTGVFILNVCRSQHPRGSRRHTASPEPVKNNPIQASQSCDCSAAQLCPPLCNPTDCSTPDLPVRHHLPEFAQVHIHCVGDAIQPSHPLMPSSPSALNLSQRQGLFQ